jgi:hypothetical protein
VQHEWRMAFHAANAVAWYARLWQCRSARPARRARSTGRGTRHRAVPGAWRLGRRGGTVADGAGAPDHPPAHRASIGSAAGRRPVLGPLAPVAWKPTAPTPVTGEPQLSR